MLRREVLAKKLSNANNDEFCKEIHSINNCTTPLPDTIINVTGLDNVLEIWMEHFYDIFNCLQKQSIDKSKILLASSHNEVLVTAEEIRQAIEKLDLNKSIINFVIVSYSIIFSLCFGIDLSKIRQ